MRTKFTRLLTLTDEELEAFIRADDHNYLEADEEDEAAVPLHADWDCETCDAELLFTHRRHLRESRLPGACSITSEEGKSYICENIAASNLAVGYQSRYLSRPGVSDYPHEYAEVLAVKHEDTGVIATWRRTNSPEEASFVAVYAPDERLNVTHYFDN